MCIRFYEAKNEKKSLIGGRYSRALHSKFVAIGNKIILYDSNLLDLFASAVFH